MKEILYSIAQNSVSEFVLAQNAEKGTVYFCPQCQAEMSIKKSGNTGKGSKRPHFAHKANESDCTPESALHLSVKSIIADRLRKHIEEGKEMTISWRCNHCHQLYKGNLLKNVATIEIERNVESFRPDISLLDVDGKVCKVIEVIVSHSPEQDALMYYRQHKIPCIEYRVNNEVDLSDMDRFICNEFSIECFTSPLCKKCCERKYPSFLCIVESDCWRCKKKMKVAYVMAGNSRNSYPAAPDEFTEQELKMAREKGVRIEHRKSKTKQETYLHNVCPHCNIIVGKHFMYEHTSIPYDEEIISGYYCEQCDSKEEPEYNEK